MHKLKSMKHSLESCAYAQMSNLESVDTKELGEVIDMIKDLAETMYYTAITEAMEEGEADEWKEDRKYYPSRKMYMEAKEKHMDKATMMKELEHYVHGLTEEVMDMMKGASAEEKTYLEKHMAALATKIGQSSL